MNATSTRPRLSVTTGAKGVVSHAGSRLLCDLADDVGLTRALAWRTLESIDDGVLLRIADARAKARTAAWEAGMDPGYYVIDIDGTLVTAHSEKEKAEPTYKRGFGFYPLIATLDATGEALAGLLRPGNAGSGTAADHVVMLGQALAQLPVDPTTAEVMVRTDAAGCSHEFVEACRERSVIFFCGRDLTVELAKVVLQIPKSRWKTTISADGSAERKVGSVAEISDLVDLSAWPEAIRMLVRREEPHPGAQLTFTDVDGHRYQLFITDHPGTDISCGSCDTGSGPRPSRIWRLSGWLPRSQQRTILRTPGAAGRSRQGKPKGGLAADPDGCSFGNWVTPGRS